jgi:hypothetical protein
LVVTIDFGAIGTRGQRRVHSVTDIAEAQVVVRWAFRRRLSAPRRIGVPYRVIACCDAKCWLAMMELSTDRWPVGDNPIRSRRGAELWHP